MQIVIQSIYIGYKYTLRIQHNQAEIYPRPTKEEETLSSVQSQKEISCLWP